MKNKFAKWSRKRKKLIKERLKHDQTDIRFKAVFSASNIHLDFSEKISAISCGGIGAVWDTTDYQALADAQIGQLTGADTRDVPSPATPIENGDSTHG